MKYDKNCYVENFEFEDNFNAGFQKTSYLKKQEHKSSKDYIPYINTKKKNTKNRKLLSVLILYILQSPYNNSITFFCIKKKRKEVVLMGNVNLFLEGYKIPKKLPKEEMQDFVDMFDAYRKLDGNTFIIEMNEEFKSIPLKDTFKK